MTRLHHPGEHQPGGEEKGGGVPEAKGRREPQGTRTEEASGKTVVGSGPAGELREKRT